MLSVLLASVWIPASSSPSARPAPAPAEDTLMAKLYSSSALRNRPCIAFIHIPKCAGTGFMTGAVRLTHGDAEETAESAALWFPGKLCGYFDKVKGAPDDCRRNSWNSPGCGAQPYGGTHCGYSETVDCLKRGLAETPKGWYASGNNGVLGGGGGGSAGGSVGKPMSTPTPSACTKLVFASVVREPIDRLISEYFWWAKKCHRDGDAWSKEACNVTKTGRGFADQGTVMRWLESPYNNAANRMTKMFATYDGAPPPVADHCIAYNAELQYGYWSKRYQKTYEEGLEAAINADDALLADARANVDRHFGFIGIQSCMYDSFALFAHLLGPDAPDPPTGESAADHSHASASGGGKKMARTKAALGKSPEFLAEARARNRLDVELFRHIASRFNASFYTAFRRTPSR